MSGLRWTLAVMFLALPGMAAAQGLPALTLTENADGGTTYSLSFQILMLMTALTVLPSIVLGMTAFTRIIIVLSILRQALGTQQTPPNQVLVALALFLTFFVMQPTMTQFYEQALGPYLDGQMPADQAIETGTRIIKAFLIENTRQNDLMMFQQLAGDGPYANQDEVPLSVLLPAFITSELKTAFQIGFLIFLPFLVIDMVVASILMALGMMMLSPMLVSLPIKLLLFVLVDGWALTVGSLAATYGVGDRAVEFDANIEHLQQAYWHILLVSGPVLGVALVVGLVVGIVQAATSINEQTLSFVPKLAIAMLTMALASGFMLTVMTDYFQTIFESIRAIR